jgi:hypothetical protein
MPINSRKSSKKKPLNDYIRYSAMGFQMAAIIFVSTWAGKLLDARLEMKIPVFTLVFAIASVVLSMYYFIKGISRKE